MKNVLLAAAATVIVFANAFALFHAGRNRAGVPDAEMTLSNRELPYQIQTLSDDDSGVTLHLRWTAPGDYGMGNQNSPRWLDQQALQRLGFNCRINPTREDALRSYERQRPRRAFVALEYDGQAWRDWLNDYKRYAEEQAKRGFPEQDYTRDQTHLVVIDADLDAGALRARYPDRSSIMIATAVVAIGLQPYPYPGSKPDPKNPVRVVGSIEQLASSIHVPRPLSVGFQRRNQRKDEQGNDLSYTVRLRYGSLLEPWVTGVEFGR